jgi:hypothetical protein
MFDSSFNFECMPARYLSNYSQADENVLGDQQAEL